MLWTHAEEVFTPDEEVMRALDDLVRSGEVLYLGILDFPAWILNQANPLFGARIRQDRAFCAI